MTTLDTSTKKTPRTPSKRMARDLVCSTSSEPIGLYENSSDRWLISEQKKLIKMIGMNADIYQISNELKRDPVVMIHQLMSLEFAYLLDDFDMGCGFALGTEEETELLGLVLSGVPLKTAMDWCLGNEGKISTTDLDGLMKNPDIRGEVGVATACGIWFSKLDEIDCIRSLGEYPEEMIKAAVDELLTVFEAPTPVTVIDVLEGGFLPCVTPYPWHCSNVSANANLSGGKRSYAKSGTKKSYGRRKSTTRTIKANKRFWMKSKSKSKSKFN